MKITKKRAHKALFEAIFRQDCDQAQLALKAGADPNATTRLQSSTIADEMPALVVASWTGSKKMVQLLLDARAKIDTASTDWATYPCDEDPSPFPGPNALCVAAQYGYLSVVWLLLRRGASPTPPESPPPICRAAKNGHLRIVKSLIINGADLSIHDGDDNSPLHYAVSCGYLDMALLIFEKGGRFSTDRDLDLAITNAKRGKYKNTLDFLQRFHRRDLFGYTISHWQCVAPECEPEAVLFALLRTLYGSCPQLGEIETQNNQREPLYSMVTRYRKTITRAFGGWGFTRVEVEHFKPPGGLDPQNLLTREIVLCVNNGIYVRVEIADILKPKKKNVFSVCIGGDKDELDRVDALLKDSLDNWKTKPLGDQSGYKIGSTRC